MLVPQAAQRSQEAQEARTERKEALLEKEMQALSTKPQEWQATQRAYQDYRAAERQAYAQPSTAAPSQPKSLWQRAGEWVKKTADNGLRWIDQHQPQTAVAVGIGVGLAAAAIVLTGGLAAPVAIGLAAGVAGLTIGAGTVGLNAYFHRPLGTNVLRNVAYAGRAAAVTSGVVIGAGLAIQGGVVQQALYGMGNAATRLCVTHPTACARVGAALTVWDKVEEIGLQAKLAIQTARGDPRAAETALELQLERMDGVPGNTTFRETQEALSTLVGRYGDEVADLVRQFGNDGAELLGKYQDDAVELLRKGERASGQWTNYVPADYHSNVIGSFEGNAVPIRLREDVIAYRYWGSKSAEKGNWLTTYSDLTPDQARALLSLPHTNSAENVSQFIIPKDTVILVGEAAGQTNKGWAGSYAIGGGLQIYVHDQSVLVNAP